MQAADERADIGVGQPAARLQTLGTVTAWQCSNFPIHRLVEM
jgi:hypothetical protein